MLNVFDDVGVGKYQRNLVSLTEKKVHKNGEVVHIPDQLEIRGTNYDAFLKKAWVCCSLDLYFK